MNIVLGFGSTETAFEEQERQFIADFLEENKHKHEDLTDWFIFPDELVERLEIMLKARTDEYKRLDKEYRTAESFPDRYSYYYYTILHDLHDIVVLPKFCHTNRRHALSPDGWAAMWTEPTFHFKSND